MKCTICGAAAMPGAMLCRPCRAALKRARYVSVVELPPSSVLQVHAARARRGGSARPPAPAAQTNRHRSPAPAPAHRRAWLRPIALGGGAIVVLAMIAWIGPTRDPPTSTAAAPVVVPRPVIASALNGPSPGPAPMPVAASAGTDPMPGPATSSAVALGARARSDPVAVPLASVIADAHANVRRTATRADAAPDATSAMLSTGPGPQGFGLDVPPLPPVIAPAPRVVAPSPQPPRDRWQTMGDELARCDREGGITGFICDQRVRIASCEGYWGRVPQCSLPPENPR